MYKYNIIFTKCNMCLQAKKTVLKMQITMILMGKKNIQLSKRYYAKYKRI